LPSCDLGAHCPFHLWIIFELECCSHNILDHLEMSDLLSQRRNPDDCWRLGEEEGREIRKEWGGETAEKEILFNLSPGAAASGSRDTKNEESGKKGWGVRATS
jgi:hypothetical protein